MRGAGVRKEHMEENRKECCRAFGTLKIIFMNARSVLNKLDELKILVVESKPDIIGITESWCHNDVSDAELGILGYRLYREDRQDTTKGRGGGVLLYISCKIPSFEIDSICGGEGFNLKFCKVQGYNGKTSTVGLVYRSPNIIEENDKILLEALEKIRDKHLVYFGDFNYPGINWNNLTAVGRDKYFLDITQNNFLVQHVDFVTRGENILDLVFSSEVNMVENIYSIGKLGSSDHDILSFNMNMYTERLTNQGKMPDFSRANWDKLKEDLGMINWENEFQNLNASQSWDRFKEILNLYCARYIAMKNVRVKNKPVWMKQNIIRIVRKKAKLWRKYKETREYMDYLKYKKVERESKKEIAKVKKDFEKRLAKDVKTNPKKFYSYVKSKSRTRDSIGPLRGLDGDTVNREEGMCSILNNYFCSVFTKPDRVDNQDFDTGYIGELLNNTFIEENTVRIKLEKLKEGKSPGPDGIFSTVLRRIKEVIAKPLAYIFNRTIEQGIVPRDWRIANVTPIFKKGRKDEAANYRPVSLTSVVCKILESIIRDRIIDHIDRNKPLKLSQHGFMKNRSCLTNLLEFFENVLGNLDSGLPVDVIYFDFSKAFDKVSHTKLIGKLKNYGISGRILDWVRSWLSDRYQRVVINGKVSDWERVLSGVPQGSVLGPLLFLIFVDDMDSAIVSKCLKFADDTKIFKQVGSEADRMDIQNDIEKLGKWGEDWAMSFNIDKCKILHLGNKNPCVKYKLYGKEISVVEKEKDLGVLVDNKLNFDEQCATAAKKGNQILGIVKRNFSYLDRDIFVRLYKGLVRPHLEYAIQAWNPYTRKNVKMLEGVQRRATKLVRNCKDLPYEERLKYLGLTTLETRRLRGDMLETFKIISGKENLNRDTFFKLVNDGVTRGHNFKLIKPRDRLNIRKFSFARRVVGDWNKLPWEVVNSKNLDQFKARIDNYYKNIGKI